MNSYPAPQLCIPRRSLPIFGTLNYGISIVERNQSSLKSGLRVGSTGVANTEKSMELTIGALRADKVLAFGCFLIAGNPFGSNGVHSETYSITLNRRSVFMEFKDLSFFENHNLGVPSSRVWSLAYPSEIGENYSGLDKQTHSKGEQHQDSFS